MNSKTFVSSEFTRT